jgi:hypothetical protein
MYQCIPIKKVDGRKFPYHDSFVGCHNTYEVFNHHIASVDGRISANEAQQIIDKVLTVRTMPKAIKSKIISCLRVEFQLPG